MSIVKPVDVKKVFILTAGLTLAFAGACSRSPAAKVVPPVPVLTAAATTQDVPVCIEPAPVGHVAPILSVNIRPQIGGIISAVHFQEGQEVKKGDLLFTIDPRSAQATLSRDKALLENAQIQFEREQKLFDQKLVSQDEFDTSKASRDTLAATVQSDELNLEYTQIRAPIDGRTGSLQVHVGNVVKSPDDVLLTINQLHPIYVVFAVAERYLPEIQKQLREHTLSATASFENMEGEPPSGELTFVDNAVDESTGTIGLKAMFPNTNDILWPGQFVTVSLQLDELTNAVMLPSQAVQVGQDGQFVFVVKSDRTVEQRPVQTGLTYHEQTVISSGVRAGETVVIDGQFRLTPGALVNDKSRSATNAP